MKRTRRIKLIALLLLVLWPSAAYAQIGESVVPGTIGVLVKNAPQGIVVVSEVRERGPAGQAGVRVGDVVLRYNGEAVENALQLDRLISDSRPGTRARLELLRAGERRMLEIPVEQLKTTPRA